MLQNSRPGPTSSKNTLLSPAATDLSLGDSLSQQLQDQLAERKKKLMAAAQTPGSLFGGAAMDLGLGNG